MYLDDIIITCNDEASVQQLIATLHTTFTLKYLGPLSYFLGIEVNALDNIDLLLT